MGIQSNQLTSSTEYGIQFLLALNKTLEESSSEYRITKIVESWKLQTVRFCLSLYPDADREEGDQTPQSNQQVQADRQKMLTAIEKTFIEDTPTPYCWIDEDNQIWIHFEKPLALRGVPSPPDRFELKKPKQEPPAETSFCTIS